MLKKVLFIDLKNKTSNAKTFDELRKYIGGVSVGLKLLLDNAEKDPVIFSVGPLNGFFPFASKTSIVFNSGAGVEDLYLGGSLSFRIKFSGFESILFLNKAEEPTTIEIIDDQVRFLSSEEDVNGLGLPGKRSTIKPVKDKYLLDEYFLASEHLLEEKLFEKNVTGISITGTKTYDIKNKERYVELFTNLLARTPDISVEKSSFPSCAGCPVGCMQSRTGEIGGNILTHSLVACSFAEKIYSNVGVVFACLNILGFDYTHEDIEMLNPLVNETLKQLS